MFQRLLVVFALVFAIGKASAAAPDRVTLPFGQKVFVSGINVAWKNFGGDVGSEPVDTVWFAKMLQGVADSGGNAVRWWLFTNCANAPVFDKATKLATGPGSATVANVVKVLDMAYARGISVDLCLLSFDMMKYSQQGVDTAANRMILQTDRGRKAFIDNAVLPLVKAVGNHPAVLDWEVFNEPEGMVIPLAGNWGEMTPGIQISDVQRTVNQVAGAIHRSVPGVLVSNGCWAFIAGSNTVPGDHNYYSDSALKAVGGDADGVLDFYMVHYYEWAKTERSPFSHPASYWGLDKPLVIAEFPAKGLSDAVGAMTPAQCWSWLHDNGYAGAMGWTYTAHDGFGGLPEAGQGMRAIKTSAPADVTIDYPPTAKDDWYSDSASRTLAVAAPGLLSNDREPTPGQTLSASLLAGATHGTVVVKADGSFTYAPTAGWSGTDRFTYIALGGAGGKDTATVEIRVLDAAKGSFFAPPTATGWGIYSAWGTLSLETLPEGMGVNVGQWGSTSTWVVDTAGTVQVGAVEQSIFVRIKNDPGSPWTRVKFQFAKSNPPTKYGPTDTISDTVTLALQPGGSNGFAQYRGVIKPTAAGAYHPALEFLWQNADGKGPSNAHQSVLADLEIFPASEVATGVASAPLRGAMWSLTGNVLSVNRPGTALSMEVVSPAGRTLANVSGLSRLDWKVPTGAGILLVRLRCDGQESHFTIPTVR
jgi:Bacterial Ig domain